MRERARELKAVVAVAKPSSQGSSITSLACELRVFFFQAAPDGTELNEAEMRLMTKIGSWAWY